MGLFAALLGLLAAAGSAGAASRAARGAEAVPNEVVVRYAPGTGSAERGALRERAGARSVRRVGVPRAQVLRVADVGRALRALRRSERVELATRNMVRRAYRQPDDPRFGELWGLHNLGALEGFTADADIDAVEAWDRVTGSDGVIVAVVDSGVASGHPDLAGRRHRHGRGVAIPALGRADCQLEGAGRRVCRFRRPRCC